MTDYLGLTTFWRSFSTTSWAPPSVMLPAMSNAFLASYLTHSAVEGVPREVESTAMGLYQAIYALGMTVLPMLVGTLAGQFTVTAAYGCLAALAFLAAAGAAVAYRHK